MKKKILFSILLCVFVVPVFADEDDDSYDHWNSANCVDSRWSDADGNKLSLDDKFGAGSAAVTRCLGKTRHVKVVYQLNESCANDACSKSYGLGNIANHIKDFEITHGMSRDEYKIAVIVMAAGYKLILDNTSANKHADDNPFQAAMQSLVDNPSVEVLFCQNTAHGKKVSLDQMIPGVGFVTAGVSAVADLQNYGYRYIQP